MEQPEQEPKQHAEQEQHHEVNGELSLSAAEQAVKQDVQPEPTAQYFQAPQQFSQAPKQFSQVPQQFSQAPQPKAEFLHLPQPKAEAEAPQSSQPINLYPNFPMPPDMHLGASPAVDPWHGEEQTDGGFMQQGRHLRQRRQQQAKGRKREHSPGWSPIGVHVQKRLRYRRSASMQSCLPWRDEGPSDQIIGGCFCT